METRRPKVGMTVFLVKWGRILLGKRLGKVGNGEWWCPGGHLEFGEAVEAGMKREVAEETGILLDSVVLGPYVEDFYENEGLHYINLTGVAEVNDADEPRTLEPEKCAGWEWFDWNELPERHSPVYDKLKSIGFDPVRFLE